MPLVVPMAVAGVLTMVRDDLLSTAVSSGLSLLGGLQASSPELKSQLEEMDVEAMLKTVEAVVNEVEADFNKHNAEPSAPPTGSSGTAAAKPTPAAADTKQPAPAAASTSGTTAASKASPAPSPSPAAAASTTSTTTISSTTTTTTTSSTTTTTTTTSDGDAPNSAGANGKELESGGWVKVPNGGDAKDANGKGGVGPGSPFTARKKSSLLNCSGNTAVALAVDQIEDAVAKIHTVLLELDAEAKAHASKYFSGWRSNGFAPLLERLRGLQSVLDKRLDLLLKVLSLKSLTSQQLAWHNHSTAQTAGATAAKPNAQAINANVLAATALKAK